MRNHQESELYQRLGGLLTEWSATATAAVQDRLPQAPPGTVCTSKPDQNLRRAAQDAKRHTDKCTWERAQQLMQHEQAAGFVASHVSAKTALPASAHERARYLLARIGHCQQQLVRLSRAEEHTKAHSEWLGTELRVLEEDRSRYQEDGASVLLQVHSTVKAAVERAAQLMEAAVDEANQSVDQYIRCPRFEVVWR